LSDPWPVNTDRSSLGRSCYLHLPSRGETKIDRRETDDTQDGGGTRVV